MLKIIIQQIWGKGPRRNQCLGESIMAQLVWLQLGNNFLRQAGKTWITIKTKNVLEEMLVKRMYKLDLAAEVILELESIESGIRVLI